MPRLLPLAGSIALLMALSGCPVTDDYYIAPRDTALSGSGGAGVSTGGRTTGGGADAASAGQAPAGIAGAGGDREPAGGETGLGAGGKPGATCVPKTERCNGRDDDCDGFKDEMACGFQGTYGCFGFTLSERDDHGYMLCSGNNQRDFEEARQACEAQDMRLAWIESESENAGLAGKVNALGGVTEVLLGGTDAEQEGDWYWNGGEMFWRGAADGDTVDDAFVAWVDNTPNDTNNEDCIVLYPASAEWGDRTCTANYAYLCEEREPLE